LLPGGLRIQNIQLDDKIMASPVDNLMCSPCPTQQSTLTSPLPLLSPPSPSSSPSSSTTYSISFRSLLPSDFESIKALHDELFPVKYSDYFYTESCAGRGMGGRPLYTSLAICNDAIVGFVLAQFVNIDSVEEKCLVATGTAASGAATDLCYILTIGVRSTFAKLGLATKLLSGCVEYARRNPTCAAVYLHVIDYNLPAIHFYERNDFVFFKEMEAFYSIDSVAYSSYLYVYYLNDYDGPLLFRLYRKTRKQWQFLSSWIQSLWRQDMQGGGSTAEFIVPNEEYPRLEPSSRDGDSCDDGSTIFRSDNHRQQYGDEQLLRQSQARGQDPKSYVDINRFSGNSAVTTRRRNVVYLNDVFDCLSSMPVDEEALS
jgi:ribosomal protein S18 acetylase RimI-like enzyme